MLAITIIVMGLGTFLIGLLPTYEQIGVAAPVFARRAAVPAGYRSRW
jgi:hypothetical protein